MSRWLKSVNTILDTLDGTAENAAYDTSQIPTSRGTIGQILNRRGLDYDEDDEDDEFYSTDEDIEEGTRSLGDFDLPSSKSDESQIMSTPHHRAPLSSSSSSSSSVSETQSTQKEYNTNEKHKSGDLKSKKQQQQQNDGYEKKKIVVNEPSSDDAVIVNRQYREEYDFLKEENELVSLPLTIDQAKFFPEAKSSVSRNPATLPTPPSDSYNLSKSHPGSTVTSISSLDNKLSQQLKGCKLDLKKSVAEIRQLRKHIMQLNQGLEASEAEVKAQQDELKRAAERIEKDRHRANEEREDLLDEQDEELENQKAQYEKEISDLKDRYEDQIEDLEDRLSMVEEKRKIEGGGWTKELEEALQREREALKKTSALKDKNATLKSSLTKIETRHLTLQARLESSMQSNQTAIDRERQAEDKLDVALSLHSRQVSQRQAREAELEMVIADMGAALARARQKEKNPKPASLDSSQISFKEKSEMAEDELETVRAQLILETERGDAVRNELSEISKERTAEALQAQTDLRQHNREVSDLKSNISRLEAIASREQKIKLGTVSVGKNDTATFRQKLEESEKQITSLSERLIEKQNTVQNLKQEILTLKNRLKLATIRANSTEDALTIATHSNASTVQESFAYGGGLMKRRIKGGRSRGATTIRSVRSALGMNPGRVSEGMEQVAITIDAIDTWLIDTGCFMKHEPLARLGFVLYLSVLHLWSFCLVAFHTSTYESIHGDFGSMSDPNDNGPQELFKISKP